jgi:glutamate carboxypeptidase
LIGHLDTVFEPDQPFQTFVRQGDWAAGPGAADDKGGIIVMLGALRAMQAAGVLRNANITVVLTGDEESMGEPAEVARADLMAEGRRADVALDFEGLVVENGTDMGSVARRSSNSWKIEASGKGGHSSGIFSDSAGDGAIFELTRIVQTFRTELPEPDLTFNVGLIAGGAQAALSADESGVVAGGKTNIIPSVAVATGDFRTLTPEQTARVRGKMLAIVARHAPGTDAHITFGESYPPMAPTPGNRELLARLNRINAALGLPSMPELPPIKRGAGDISFVAADVDGLAGLGPASTGDHSPAERVDLASFSRQAKRAAMLMVMLSREPSGKTGR